MEYRDITTDTQSTYRLKERERVVFFMWNRTGDITFELTGEYAEARVYAFYVGSNTDQGVLTIAQRHQAPRTTSHVQVRSVLSDASSFSYTGILHIDQKSVQADASQENRNLLLSPKAVAFSKPTLEILESDVRCRHAATTSPLDPEKLYYAKTRGIPLIEGKRLLTEGFLWESLEAASTLISSQEKEKMVALVRNSLKQKILWTSKK